MSFIIKGQPKLTGQIKGKSIGRPPMITDGLVMYLDARLVESYPGTGNQWLDLSGNNKHATLYGGYTYNTDGGGSIAFNGTDGYARATSVWNLGTFSNVSTCEIGHRYGDIATHYLSNERTSGGVGDGRLMATGEVSANVYGSPPYSYSVVPTPLVDHTAPALISASTTFASSSMTVNYMINGEAQTQSKSINRSSNPINFANILIGRWVNYIWTNTYLACGITHVRIYNRTLTAEEQYQNYLYDSWFN